MGEKGDLHLCNELSQTCTSSLAAKRIASESVPSLLDLPPVASHLHFLPLFHSPSPLLPPSSTCLWALCTCVQHGSGLPAGAQAVHYFMHCKKCFYSNCKAGSAGRMLIPPMLRAHSIGVLMCFWKKECDPVSTCPKSQLKCLEIYDVAHNSLREKKMLKCYESFIIKLLDAI